MSAVDQGVPASASEESYLHRIVSEVENNGEEDGDIDMDSEVEDPSDAESVMNSISSIESDSEYDTTFNNDEWMVPEFNDMNEPNTNSLSEPVLSNAEKSSLAWRADKSVSFSDWTINISAEGEANNPAKTYNVHRQVLGFGPGKSEFYADLFQSSRRSLKSNSMELPAKVAADFPAFLDYMYSNMLGKTTINRDNWRSLYFLAGRLQVPKLLEAVEAFIEVDMQNIDHIERYLSEFPDPLEDDTSLTVHRYALRVCAKMILVIKPESSLLKAMSPEMFITLIHVLERMRQKYIMDDPNYIQHLKHTWRLIVAFLKDRAGTYSKEFYNRVILDTSYLEISDDQDMYTKISRDLYEIEKEAGYEIDNHSWTWRYFSKCYLPKLQEEEMTNEERLARVVNDVPSNFLAKFLTENMMKPTFASFVEKEVPANRLATLFISKWQECDFNVETATH